MLAIIVFKVSAPLGNADTWFHLRFGAEFWNQWSLNDPGSVSTFGTKHWLPTQWLGEMLMYAFDHAFGLPGVAWLSGTLVLAYCLVVYLNSRGFCEPLCAVLVTAVTLGASAGGLSARPQVWSFVLVSTTTAAWLRTGRDLRARWWLIPLTWVWAMLHGMWILGPVIGVVATVGIILDSKLVGRSAARLLAIPLGSLAAAAVTPVGPGLYGAVFSVGSRAWYFSEWQATSFRAPSAIAAVLLIMGALAIFARNGGAPALQIVLLVVAGGWAAYAERTVPVGAAIAAPIAGAALQSTLGRAARTAKMSERMTVIAATLVAVAVLAAAVPFAAREPADPRPRLDAALDALPAGTTVLDDDTLGGWLMWRHPRLNVVIDGYADQYPTAWMRRYRAARELRPGWQEFVNQTHAHYALLYGADPFTHALLAAGWHPIGRQAGVELIHLPKR